MRIISGTLKGKLINFLKNSTTRPLKDSVKENIFNILKHSKLINVKIEKANILDLYSGVGSFGIECISRGADKVTFIEQDKNAFNMLKKNMIYLSINNQVNILNNKIENIVTQNKKTKYSIFFFDPPFADKEFIQNLNLIKKNNLFKTKHIVIIHREKKSKDSLENSINVLITKIYGRSKIIFGIFN
ncbi:16S rRNA (guanine(966)-N(2))-methyltransferase RsmD [Pelagibacteraceae bacterium]|jgi:16S rRNA (guanine966-N2)-methyltransferase|nr:16S rRNA (guanine(966)-N(2))-methyltransferase RsmD [Pelagibacteraceae bacterium]